MSYHLRPEHRLALGGASFSLYLVVVLGMLFNLFHEKNLVHLTELAIATIGGVFAVLAMIDAHRAFLKAVEVEQAIGSFRMTFADVLQEMVGITEKASSHLGILIPTPAYGFLFGEQERSTRLVTAIVEFGKREGTHMELFLVAGSSANVKASLPQKYLQRSHKAPELANTYSGLVAQVFDLAETLPDRVTLRTLANDPNVRIALADPDTPDSGVCAMSFAQSTPGEKNFESKGFKSTRAEMVRAVSDLLQVYREQSTKQDARSLRPLFTTLL